MSDDSNKQEPGLTDKINELESLVKKNSGENYSNGQIIPILDELVSPEDYDEAQDGHEKNEDIENRFDDLADIVERKLSSELDEIVNLLKGNLKNSIIHELQDQIKKEPDK